MTTMTTDPAVRVLNGSLLCIPTHLLLHGPNARGDLGDVSDLAISLAALGQQTALIVEPADSERFSVFDGNRRLAAARRAGLPHLFAILRRAMDESDRTLAQLAIHAQVRPFEPIAEARALHTLMWEHNLDRHEIAAKIGKGPGWVRDRLALLQLDEDEQAAVERRDLPIGAAVAVVRERRNDRVGRPTPPTKPAHRHRPACACTGGTEQHFTKEHPLAAAALERCQDSGEEHLGRLPIGGVACGECWEQTIRADQPHKHHHVDDGHSERLTPDPSTRQESVR